MLIQLQVLEEVLHDQIIINHLHSYLLIKLKINFMELRAIMVVNNKWANQDNKDYHWKVHPTRIMEEVQEQTFIEAIYIKIDK